MGFEIKVILKAPKDQRDAGNYDGRKHKVIIDPKASEQTMQQVFWHEWMHCALGTLGYTDLDNDERFVDQMASLLYQLERTRKDPKS